MSEPVTHSKGGMFPLFLVKPGSMNQRDIRRVEKLCGIVVAECADPDAARYSDPPLGATLDDQARAALELLRIVKNQASPDLKRGDLMRWFVDALLEGTKPKAVLPVKAPR
jgi:hypothetical protein